MNSPGACFAPSLVYHGLIRALLSLALPGIYPQLGSTMHAGSIFCSVQVALISLSSGIGYLVLLLFSELLLVCTMAPLPSTCGVRWGNWTVKYVLYLLLSSQKVDLICLERLTFCSMESPLVPTVSSSLSSAVQKLPFHRPLGAFSPPNIASARAPKLSSCFISRAFCHLRYPICPPVCLVCILYSLPSGLVWCIVSRILRGASCPRSWLFELLFIFCSVKVGLLCGILPCLN